MGKDDDQVQINGDIGSKVKLEDGDDKIQLNSDSKFEDGAKIDGGKGDDTLYFTGSADDYVVETADGGSFSFMNFMNSSGNSSNSEVNIYKVDSNGDKQGNALNVKNVENIVFEADEVTTQAQDAVTAQDAVAESWTYSLTLNAGLTDTDDSEILGLISVNNLPEGASITGDGVTAVTNDDGEVTGYTVSTNDDGEASVSIVSSTEIAQDDLNSITSSVTSTESNGGDTASITTNIAGDDQIDYDDTSTTIDGGTGFDSLVVGDDADIDFDNITSDALSNIEAFDLTNGSHNITNLDLTDVIDMTNADNELKIFGDADDSVALQNTVDDAGVAQTWEQGETSVADDDGNQFITFSNNDVSVLIDSDVVVTMG